jgi:bifunctional non-homologous end joining protein LigD
MNGLPPAARPEEFPRLLRPMLAVAGELPERDAGFGYEFKWDGVRAAAFVRRGNVVLRSRNDRDITASFPELTVLGELLGDRQVVLDGEIVALDEAGRPDFGLLQQRIHVRSPSGQLREAVPVSYYVFDVTHLDGRGTRALSYQDRRGVLDGVALEGPGVHVPPSFAGGGADVLDASREQGLEGIMAKRLDSPYLPGRRSDLWLKVKISRTQEVVVGGWQPGEGRRRGTIGSLLVGIPGRGGLRYAGRVGTGFTDSVLRQLLGMLRPLERRTSPFADRVPRETARAARWVEPRLVGEVRFTEWTRDGVLRHPSWRGLRPDKSPQDVRRES